MRAAVSAVWATGQRLALAMLLLLLLPVLIVVALAAAAFETEDVRS